MASGAGVRQGPFRTIGTHEVELEARGFCGVVLPAGVNAAGDIIVSVRSLRSSILLLTLALALQLLNNGDRVTGNGA